MNGEFSIKVKRILAKRANERCTICNISTSKPNLSNPTTYINVGEAAHIRGAQYAGHNRYDESMNNEQRSSIENAIWLCPSCHKEVDSDSDRFTVNFLHEQKKIHEENITSGEYDIQWKEYNQLKVRIENLEKLINEKEKNETLKNKLNDIDLTRLKVDLEQVLNEKAEIERNYDLLKNATAGFGRARENKEIKDIVTSINKGDFETAKRELSVSKIEEDEKILARKRLLRANLEEIEKDYNTAETNFRKASLISTETEFFENYIAFLLRRGKIEEALLKCKNELEVESNLDKQVWLNSALGEIFSSLNNSSQAIHYLINAKNLLENIQSTKPEVDLTLAKVLNGLGSAHKNLGEYDEALLLFQDSLNLYWQATVKYGIVQPKNLGALHVSIGTVYLENNNPKEALDYYGRAELAFKDNIFKEHTCYFEMIILGLNSINAFLHPKINNITKAREIINKVKHECLEIFTKYPLHYLKYYLGALAGSANIYMREANPIEAEKEYLKAINLYEQYHNELSIVYKDTIAMLYFNYAVVLANNRIEESKLYSQKAVDILLAMPNLEHGKHINLAILFSFRSQLSNQKSEIEAELIKAQQHISLCNIERSLDARMWKMIIDENLRKLN